jgi:hypothetical protein
VNVGWWRVEEFIGSTEKALEQLQPLEKVVANGRKPVWATTSYSPSTTAIKLPVSHVGVGVERGTARALIDTV